MTITVYVPGTEEQDQQKLILSLQQIAGKLAAGLSGQLTGTTTNDDAEAGCVGEYVSSTIDSTSAVALVSGTPADVTSISLTAGDWDISAAAIFFPDAATSIINHAVAVSAVSNTLDATYVTVDRFTPFVPVNPLGGHAMPLRRASLAATTTFYLVAQSQFTVSTMGAYGLLSARRVR